MDGGAGDSLQWEESSDRGRIDSLAGFGQAQRVRFPLFAANAPGCSCACCSKCDSESVRDLDLLIAEGDDSIEGGTPCWGKRDETVAPHSTL